MLFKTAICEARMVPPAQKPAVPIVLRPYQEAAVSALRAYFDEKREGNPLIVMPTGTGKSVVIAEFVHWAVRSYPGTRVLMVTHVKELVEQNATKLQAVWPSAPLGIYSAGLRSRQVAPITFGSIQTLYNKAAELGHVHLVLVDEAHMIPADTETMYRSLLETLHKRNPRLRVIGFTATPFRMKTGHLLDGGVFTDIAFDCAERERFVRFIDEGYLVPLYPVQTRTQVDTSSVRVTAGEYNARDLQSVLDREALTEAILDEAVQHGQGRRAWLVFCAGIDHAVHVAEGLRARGIEAAAVHSRMPSQARDDVLRRFKAGDLQAVTNNGILTTGFDHPGIDLILMLRPTRSPGLWVQMLGRGTRPLYAPGYDLSTQEGRLAAIAASPKQDCLVLDFAGNAERLGPINDPVLPKKRRRKGGEEDKAPVKTCPECQTITHASARHCPRCGFEFPRETKLRLQPSAARLVATEEPEEVDVETVRYRRHAKPGKPPSLRVTYSAGLLDYSEWHCFEHTGYARQKAREWWLEAGGRLPVPETVEDAMARLDEVAKPTKILVRPRGRYFDVLRRFYA